MEDAQDEQTVLQRGNRIQPSYLLIAIYLDPFRTEEARHQQQKYRGQPEQPLLIRLSLLNFMLDV